MVSINLLDGELAAIVVTLDGRLALGITKEDAYVWAFLCGSDELAIPLASGIFNLTVGAFAVFYALEFHQVWYSFVENEFASFIKITTSDFIQKSANDSHSFKISSWVW